MWGRQQRANGLPLSHDPIELIELYDLEKIATYSAKRNDAATNGWQQTRLSRMIASSAEIEMRSQGRLFGQHLEKRQSLLCQS